MQFRTIIMGVLILSALYTQGFDKKSTHTIEKNMQLSSAETSSMTMYVANINGNIEVQGYNGNDPNGEITKKT